MNPEVRLQILENMVHHLMNEVQHLLVELVDVLKVVEELRRQDGKAP